jgi:tryptophanyl-tRNA synthetase
MSFKPRPNRRQKGQTDESSTDSQRVGRDRAGRTSSLFTAYRELLSLPELTPKQMADLRRIIGSLGKQSADVAKDVALLSQARTVADKVRTAAELGDEAVRSSKETQKAGEDLNATIGRLQEEHRIRVVKSNALQQRVADGQAATHELSEMIGQSPDLLSHLA